MDVSTLIKAAHTKILEDLFTMELGEVVKVYASTSSSPPFVHVKLLVTDWDGNAFPVLTSVPVLYLGTGNSGLFFTPVVGDQGIVLFMGRGIDLWKQLGTIQVADEVTRFWLNNAVFVPGLRALTRAIPGLADVADRMVFGYLSATAADKRTIEISSAGIRIGSGTIELLEQIRDALEAIRDTVVATALGPQPLLQTTRLALGGLGLEPPGVIDKIDEVRDGS